jgi:ribonuclease R
MCRHNDFNIFKDLYTIKHDPNIVSITPKYLYHYDCSEFETKHYVELLHLNTFTVDPDEAKDFDDAISVDNKFNKIYIHIVDINRHIEIDSEIDVNAFLKAFTFYTEEGNVNMLPNNLAENELSLVVGKERYAITIELQINDETQEIEEYSMYNSLIMVKNRYTYQEFNEIKYSYPTIVDFCNKWKKQTLNIPFLKPIIERNSGKMIDYKLLNCNDDAHKIIETLMIHTNLLISSHLLAFIPQRFHEKIDDGCIQPNSVDVVSGNETIDSILAIKKYKNANYSSENKGHYALGLNTYTHFTSPMRRYFDVIVHRILAGISYTNLEEILDYINSRELENEKLYKLYKNMKILGYLGENMSKIWDGYVIDITTNGYSVIIEELLYNVFVFNSNCFNKSNLIIGSKVNIKIKSINWASLDVKCSIV